MPRLPRTDMASERMGLLSDVTSVFVGRTPPMGPVPALGEHATVVLAELGVGTEEVDALRGQGVV